VRGGELRWEVVLIALTYFSYGCPSKAHLVIPLHFHKQRNSVALVFSFARHDGMKALRQVALFNVLEHNRLGELLAL
jgi:hypothetical protein